MGLFDKIQKRSDKFVSQKSDEYILKEKLDAEVTSLQEQFRTKQSEVESISEKLDAVSKEYDLAVANLMSVKKELKQKNAEMDAAQRKHRDLEAVSGTDAAKSSAQRDQDKAELAKIREDLAKVTQKYTKAKDVAGQEQKKLDSIRTQQGQEQKKLDSIRTQQGQAKKELDKTNSILFNKKQELARSKNKTISKTGQMPQTGSSGSDGIIEAASAVVASIKSKLNIAEKELKDARQMLKKERQDHDKTRKELQKLKGKSHS